MVILSNWSIINLLEKVSNAQFIFKHDMIIMVVPDLKVKMYFQTFFLVSTLNGKTKSAF